MAQRHRSRSKMQEDQAVEDAVTHTNTFRFGRMILGGILAFMAIDNLRELDGRIAYAEANGAVMPEISVPGMSALLLVGSAGIALWRYPMASAAAVVSFFAGVTPVMHDFWNVDDPQEKQQQMTHFLKNIALLGATLALVAVGRRSG